MEGSKGTVEMKKKGKKRGMHLLRQSGSEWEDDHPV